MIKSTTKHYVIITLVAFTLGFIGWRYIGQSIFESRRAENATIVLEKIKTVTKLIAIEGQFSELYTFKEYYNYDFFNLFSKKIILRVNAKVSVGYDFDKLKMIVDSNARTLTLLQLPQPEILSIDHDLDYYDISVGTFNSFTVEEYNKINKDAKNLINLKAKNTPLLAEAEKQKENYLQIMRMALESAGWKLVIQPTLTNPLDYTK